MKKITFQKGAGDNQCTYPITQPQLEQMQPCRLVNPCVGKAHGTKIPDDFDIVAAMWEIDQVRKQVTRGIFPYDFMQKYYPFKSKFKNLSTTIPEPLAIEGLSYDNPAQLANVVHMDNPADMPHAVLKWLTNPMYGQRANVNAHTDQHINFLETIPHVVENIGDGIKRGLDRIFEVKYHHGLARPEEVYKQVTGTSMPEYFTAYDEGCPNHPSAGQGHEAAAIGGCLPILEMFSKDMSDAQLKVILDTVYLWGQFRCLAGVHYGIDALVSLVAEPKMHRHLKPEILQAYTA